jgi:2-polyprenyl-3-methyl-5-hydroxy-6-metoxy-1,4-benzoquinol methylase
MVREQVADAQDLYDERSERYDNSFHVRFAKHFVEMANIQTGESVLDLACGTGLVSYFASTAVGPTGTVVGLDVSTGMLQKAKNKTSSHHLQNTAFYLHSITDLDTLSELKVGSFDVITCCSALVLLQDPAHAIKQWSSYLKPGGRMIVDVTHTNTLAPGFALEAVGRRLNRPLPWYRAAFQKPEDLKLMMEDAGLHSVKMSFVSQMDIEGTDRLEDYERDVSQPKYKNVYDAADADSVFDQNIDTPPMKSLAGGDIRDQARVLFKEEWSKMADADGKVHEVDGVFVGIGRKL